MNAELEDAGSHSERSLGPIEKRRRNTVLAAAARTGAWGLFLGFAAALTAPLGPGLTVPVGFASTHGVHGIVAGIGLGIGGLGTIATSALVLRRVGRSMRRVTFAAALGLLLGSAALLWGLHWLFPGLPGVASLLPTAIALVVVLASALAFLLAVGIMAKIREGPESDGFHR